MLTIQGTLQLNSLTPLKTGSDVLSRKILGNYQLMGPSVSAQDLLHMTMLPTEVYLQEGGGSNVSVSQNVTLANEQRLELFNSFFNRIMLLNTQDFTYQDEVFVSWFLRKTGITDTEEFINQVRKLTEQNVHVTSLVEQYFTEGNELHALAVKLYELRGKPVPKEEAPETMAPQARYFLQQEIFKRLQTSFLNNFIYDTRKYVLQTREQTPGQEMSLYEQIQMADTIQLAELKQMVLLEEQAPVHQQFRFYEQIPLPSEQVNEKTVMKYLGASILTNFISQMSYSLLEKQENKPAHWVDYHKAFYGSSENTLKRFLELHKEEYRNYRNDSYMEAVNRLYESEEQILQLFSQYQMEQGEEAYPAYQMIHALLELQNQEKQAEELLYQNTLPKAGEIQAVQTKEQPHREILTVLMEAEERLRQQSQQLPYLLLTKTEQVRKEAKTPGEGRVLAAQVMEETALPMEQLTYSNDFRQTVQNQFFTQEEYKRYLDEINEKNIYNQTLLNNSKIEKQAQRTILVDRKMVMRKSLEALKQPEKVLKEMLAEGQPIERQANLEIQRLLALAEEPVRKLYQKILYPEEAGRSAEGKEAGGQEALSHPAGEFQLTPAEPEQLRRILLEGEHNLKLQSIPRALESGKEPGRVLTKSREDVPVSGRQGEEILLHPTEPWKQGSALKAGEETTAGQERLVREIQTITRESRRAVSNLVWQPHRRQQEAALLKYRPALEAAAPDGAEEQKASQGPKALPSMGRAEQENTTGQEAFQILRKVQAGVGTGFAEASQTTVFTEGTPSPVNLIFKEEQAPIEEEVLEQITRNSRVINQQQENTTEMIKNSTVIQEKLKETRQEILVENRKNITELIQRSLQTQMSTISDQVYQNLERRLYNERKRRGY